MAGSRTPGPIRSLLDHLYAGVMERTSNTAAGPLGMHLQSSRPEKITTTPINHDHPGVSSSSSSPAPAPAGDAKRATQLSVSTEGLTLLKSIEELHLKPYDDQTGKHISAWVKGATIGYGHLIRKSEWSHYKNGITTGGADSLFEKDLSPFVKTVQAAITVPLKQNQFDALFILAFNIGPDNFTASSVVKLVNNPKAATGYANLESAWKAWNKSQGAVMKGLDNRRNCEWKIYSQGVYERW